MLNEKALVAALKEHSLASHYELPPIRWLERAIEVYLATLAKAGLGIRPREATKVMTNSVRGSSLNCTPEFARAVWRGLWDAYEKSE